VSSRLCSVSVDLDDIDEYRGLHGLAQRDRGAQAVHLRALARFGELAGRLGIPLTLFAIGKNLEIAACARPVGQAAAAGHLVENHSYGHRYDLSRLSREEMAAEVQRAGQLIAGLTGRAPVGFRAPGYAVSDRLLDVLAEAGLGWDSSVFPCLPYYLTKLLAVALIRLQGGQSRAIIDRPGMLLAPTRPYRPARPFRLAGGRGLLELPIAVTPLLRLPVIGTSLTLAGVTGARWLARRCVGQQLINLELHGIDLLDRTDGLSDLAAKQPDLVVPVSRKIRIFSTVVELLRSQGYRFVTLAEAAQLVG